MGNRSGEDDRTPPRALSATDAWIIAMTWQTHLHGCVRLETDPARSSFELLQRFEYVTFILNGHPDAGLSEIHDPLATAAYARAATVTWFALSCCPGYSGAENPSFWRRVFSEMIRPIYPTNTSVLQSEQPTRPQLPITDAIQFFDGEHTFPRIMLVPKPGSEAESIAVLLGQQLHSTNSSREQQLIRIMVTLKPFINTSLWSTRSVSVAVDEVSVASLARIMDVCDKSRHVESAASHSPISQQQQQVRMLLQSISLTGKDIRHFLDLSPLQSAVGMVVIKSCILADLLDTSSHKLLQIQPKHIFHIPTIDLSAVHWSPPSTFDLAALCSALPHLSALSTAALSFTSPAPEYTITRQPLHKLHWAWLGYAIFHPDTIQPSRTPAGLVKLDLDLQGTTQADVKILSDMAMGNNVLNAVTVTSANERHCQESYYQGQVCTMADVRVDPRADADVIYTLPDTTWLDLCVCSTDIAPFDDYVAAIVPGIGLGWVHRDDIIQAISQPAAPSCVRGLRVAMSRAMDGTGALLQLLSAIGARLTSLEIHDHERLRSEDVHALLRHCPLLQCLRIQHDGSYWSSDQNDDPHQLLGQQLRELELHIDHMDRTPPTLQPLSVSGLPQLAGLRIVTNIPQTLMHNRETLLQLVANHRKLRYFHWQNDSATRSAWHPMTYEMRYQPTAVFHKLLTAGVHDVAQAPMPLGCWLAFLSVLCRVDPSTTASQPLANIGQDVVRHILQFATSSEARVIWITGERLWLQGEGR